MVRYEFDYLNHVDETVVRVTTRLEYDQSFIKWLEYMEFHPERISNLTMETPKWGKGSYNETV